MPRRDARGPGCGISEEHLAHVLDHARVSDLDASSSLVLHEYPRDPPVLKIQRRVNFGTGRKFGMDVAKKLGGHEQ